MPVCNSHGVRCLFLLKRGRLLAYAHVQVCYDLLNIIPYLKKHGSDPVTGEKMEPKDLIRLHFAKNSEDNYHDPLTFKLFTKHSAIVAIKTSGNVYSKDSVDRLNIKANNWMDLLDNTPFKRSDIIVYVRSPRALLLLRSVTDTRDNQSLQDPHNPNQRDLKKFKHLDANLKPIVDESNDGSVNNINVSATGGAGEPSHFYPVPSVD